MHCTFEVTHRFPSRRTVAIEHDPRWPLCARLVVQNHLQRVDELHPGHASLGPAIYGMYIVRLLAYTRQIQLHRMPLHHGNSQCCVQPYARARWIRGQLVWSGTKTTSKLSQHASVQGNCSMDSEMYSCSLTSTNVLHNIEMFIIPVVSKPDYQITE